MLFHSVRFLLFFPIVVACYFIIPRKLRMYWLLAASYYFYMSWNPSLVFLIAFTTLVSYAAGLLMARTENTRSRKAYLIITLIACLGVLFFYKYFNFLSDSVVEALKLTLNFQFQLVVVGFAAVQAGFQLPGMDIGQHIVDGVDAHLNAGIAFSQ